MDADGIQPHQRNRKTAPHFLLKLGEHAFYGQNQNPLAAAPADQLTDEDATGQGFPKAHSIGDQNTLAGLLQCLDSGIELVRNQVHGGLVADIEIFIRGRRLPKQAFHVEQGFLVGTRCVIDQLGVRRVQDFDVLVDLVQKNGILVPDEFRYADNTQSTAGVMKMFTAEDI